MLEQIGVLHAEDEQIPDSLTDSVYFAVWSTFQVISRSQRKEIALRLVGEQQESLDMDATPQSVLDTYNKICDDSSITEEEILEIAEKRFGKSLPMESINLLVLMEMH